MTRLNIVKVFLIIQLLILTRGHIHYSKKEQHLWCLEYETCCSRLQSPIPLTTSKSVALPLPALEMIGYHDFLDGPILLENNAHSVEIHIKQGSSSQKLPYIFGAMMNSSFTYKTDRIHFHWGMRNDRGSEHTLNGLRYPMEMHIVHHNSKYSDLSNALQHEDGLVVLGVFFQLQEVDNKNLYPLINNLQYVKHVHTLTQLNTSFVLSSFLPEDIDIYYTYKGSLTTPPCNEVVTWIIFSSPVPISFKQMNTFRLLSNGEEFLVDNYRNLQSIGHRKVYVRKLKKFSTKKRELANVNVTNLSWFWQ